MTTDGAQTNRFAGQSLGRYAVARLLGSGGMGAVYLARDHLLGRDVAVKTLRPSAGVSTLFRERFFQEARAIGALAHPNVVRVFDMGIEKDTPFLVMELVSGPSLQERLKERVLQPNEARTLGVQIARALAAAHHLGIIHRDVKPSNILEAEPGVWKLADFGVARIPDSSLTLAGEFLGTPAYAAYETMAAGTFSAASDAYALAATLYEALVGDPPFGSDGLITVAARVAQGPPRPVSEKRPDAPRDLDAAITMALARDPASRPLVSKFAEQLAQGSIPPLRRPRTRRRLALLGGGVALASLLAVGFLLAGAIESGTEPNDLAGDSSRSRPASTVAPSGNGRTQVLPAVDLGAPAGPDASAAVAVAVDASAEIDAPFVAASIKTVAASPKDPDLAAVRKLIKRGQKRTAIKKLVQLQRQHRQSAAIAYLLGNLYFDRLWWKDGLDAYRGAIRLNPAYREDPVLIRNVVRNLMSPRQHWRGAQFLEREIGPPALPYIEEGTRSKSASVRKRSARLLRRMSRTR